MARNGSGTYSLPSTINPVAPNTLIEAAWANDTLDDIAVAITGSVAADGQTPMSAPLLLAAGTTGAPGLAFNAEAGTGLSRPATNTLAVSINASEKLRVDSSGNVGINNTNPQQKLDVTGVVRFGDGTQIGELSTQSSYVNIGARSNHNLSLITNNTEVMRLTAGGVIQDAGGLEIGYRVIPRVTTFALAARGKCVAVSAGFTVANSTFSAGDCISIYNDSGSAVTITQGSGVTLRLNGTTLTGNRTLAARGMVTIWFNTASEAIIGGGGLT